MKYITKLLIFLLISTSASLAQTVMEPLVSVMSFNIRYGTANDGENHWNNRKAQVIEYLKSSDSDLIGLQEVLKFQLDEITDALPGYGFIGVSREGNWEDEFSAILYKKEEFIPRKTNTYWLSDTPERPSKGWGNDIMRIVTWAELKHIRSDRSLYLYNAHFDHRSQDSREKGALQLLNAITARDHKYPVIVTGDFNAGESNPAIETLKNGGLIDTFRKINTEAREVGTFNGFKGDNSGEKIDYVFADDTLDVIDAAIDRTNHQGKYPSDHYPVTAIVQVKD